MVSSTARARNGVKNQERFMASSLRISAAVGCPQAVRWPYLRYLCKFKVTKHAGQSPPARRDKAGHPEATDQTGAQRDLPGRDPGGQPGRSEAASGDPAGPRARHSQEEGGQATKSADLPLSALRAGRRDLSQAL